MLPTTPNPPATNNAPLVILVLVLVLPTTTCPPVCKLPVMPAPPVTRKAPVVLLVASMLALNVARLAPAVVTITVCASDQYSPELLAATEYTLGAPTVPAPKALAEIKSKLLSAPARYVTAMLSLPDAGGVAKINTTLPAM